MDEFEDELGLSREALDAWEVPQPPEGFSAEVMRAHAGGEAREPSRSRMSRRRLLAMVASISMAMAGAWLWSVLEHDGSLHADARTTRDVGPLVLVAEEGASVDWSVGRRGGHVHQTEGDVFYRVDGPTDLSVETPAGNVDVEGTCFRVRISDADIETEENEMRRTTAATAAMGIALGALVTVTVYEGRVAFANDSGDITAEAGEEIVARRGETPRSRQAFEAETLGERSATPSSPSLDPRERARLESSSPAELRARIDAMREREVAQLAEIQRLRGQVEAEEQPHHQRHWYPPSQSELEELAQRCDIQLDLPPVLGIEPGEVGDDASQELGLQPGEELALNEAIARVQRDFNDQLRALYDEATGTEAGALSPHAILTDLRDKGAPGEVSHILERIARERAGLQAPPAEATWSAVERAYRAYAALPAVFQDTVAESLGAERAEQLRAENGGWPWGRSSHGGCPED